MDFISITRIWVQLLFNIRWLIYYLWWSIANRNSHFSFLHHMSEANASYLEWNGKCFITKLLHLKRLVWIWVKHACRRMKHFELKTSEFRCEMKFWKSLHFCKEKVRMDSNDKRKLTQTAKIFHLPLVILSMKISFPGGLMHGYRRSCKAA